MASSDMSVMTAEQRGLDVKEDFRKLRLQLDITLFINQINSCVVSDCIPACSLATD